MYKLGYQHGHAARETGRGMQSNDSAYVSGYCDGYSAKGAEISKHAAGLAAAAAGLAWDDWMHVSQAKVGHITYAVEYDGRGWTGYWMNARTRYHIACRPTLETCKAAVALHVAKWM